MPPVLEVGAGNPPSIGAATGLGTGGGAGLDASPFGEAWFDVAILAGKSPSASGGFTLFFASAPRTIVAGAPDGLGAVTVTPSGNNLVIAWTGAALVPGKRYRLHFQWATLT